MEYLVMECGLSYAVVLDQEGRFIKVPNLGYEVGQTLDQVVLPSANRKTQFISPQLLYLVASVACLFILTTGCFHLWQSPVGTVRMQINPDVQMSINRFQRVIHLDGLNNDGVLLTDGYRFYGKKLILVSDELADLAMDMGYLSDEGQITLTIASAKEKWKTRTEETLVAELNSHFNQQIQIVTILTSDSEKIVPAFSSDTTTPASDSTNSTPGVDPSKQPLLPGNPSNLSGSSETPDPEKDGQNPLSSFHKGDDCDDDDEKDDDEDDDDKDDDDKDDDDKDNDDHKVKTKYEGGKSSNQNNPIKSETPSSGADSVDDDDEKEDDKDDSLIAKPDSDSNSEYDTSDDDEDKDDNQTGKNSSEHDDEEEDEVEDEEEDEVEDDD